MSRAAECYPWAGVGYDWRSVGKKPNDSKWFSKGHEKCWYIVTRDTQTKKYGLLCVWGPDQYGDGEIRPYSGHPLFLDFDKMYEYQEIDPEDIHWDANAQAWLPTKHYFWYYNDKKFLSTQETWNTDWTKKEIGKNLDPANDSKGMLALTLDEPFYKPKGADGTYVRDNTYSIAFSDNGMSYVHNTGSAFSDTPRWFMINSTDITASRHDWVPKPSTSTVFNIHKGGSQQIPGSACFLLNVAGNLKATNRNETMSSTERTDAWVWMMPDYPEAYPTIRVRAQVIEQWGLNQKGGKGYRRINIQETNNQFSGFKNNKVDDTQYGKEGFRGYQPYVVPLTNTYDALLQLNQSDWLDGKHANLVYLPYEKTYKEGNNDNYLDKLQTFTLGVDYCNISGGCSFDFDGEKYLVLAITRQGNYNMGDFTIYRVTVNEATTYQANESFANKIHLTPVCNYTSPAIAGKQYSTANKNNESTNAHRTFIRCFNRKKNATAGINHDFVEIYLYLPGRTINMYTFYGTTINPATPDVEVGPNKVAEGYPNQWGTAQASDKRHQKLTHYDTHAGKTEDRVIDDSYEHLKEYYVNYTWNTPFVNATKERDTKWMVNSFIENKTSYQNLAGTWIPSSDTTKESSGAFKYAPSGVFKYYDSNSNEWKEVNREDVVTGYCNKTLRYTNYRGLVQNPAAIEARPEFKRYFAGKDEPQTVWGNVNRAQDKLTYKPQPVPSLSVKVFYDDSNASKNARARVGGKTLYRVDINFSKASTTATTDNGKTYTIPATRYEITRSKKNNYNGLLDDGEDETAAVMIGNNTHAHWKNGTNTENPYDGTINGVEYHKGYVNLKYAAVQHETYNGTKSIVIPGNYPFDSWKNYALPAMGYGHAEDKSEACVLSFLTYDDKAASDTYRVRAIYGTDNWNHEAGYTTIAPTSIGVSQYADKTATPSEGPIQTGVDDIATVGVNETDVEYFNLQGVRVDAENLAPGMYIRRSNLGTRKVVVQ